MDDPEVTDPIFKTTSKAGLETVAWLDAGTLAEEIIFLLYKYQHSCQAFYDSVDCMSN